MTIRTRFAPSPTGFLHVGSARTALYAWLYARKYGGQFILRIEDTDKEREVEGSIGHIMECLRWLGLMWDEGPNIDGPYAPYVQSARLELYKEYARKLLAAGFAYPDPYTSEEIEVLRQQAIGEKRAFLYREHRPHMATKWDGTQPLRFRVPALKRYEWVDLVRGPLSAGEEALDDFILMKGDGFPTYNFCHVVDDIEMKVTHVMRGEEFISSTPKFLSLYEALKTAPPQFATLPPILGETGTKKLSKRDGAKDILDYRAEGYLPEALVNFLALLGWNPGTEQEVFSMEALIAHFDLARVQRSGAMFDDNKLLFINQQWMRGLSDEEFLMQGQLVAPEAVPKSHVQENATENQIRLLKSVPLLKERAHTFSEAQDMLTGELSCLFTDPNPEKTPLLAKEPKNNPPGLTKTSLTELLEHIQALSQSTFESGPEALKTALMGYADANPKEQGGRGAILWPLRYALSGKEHSPDPFSLIYILGKDESIFRIQTALAILD